jgi:hypothetical protein
VDGRVPHGFRVGVRGTKAAAELACGRILPVPTTSPKWLLQVALATLIEENLRAALLLLDPDSAAAPKRSLCERALLLTGFAVGVADRAVDGTAMNRTGRRGSGCRDLVDRGDLCRRPDPRPDC